MPPALSSDVKTAQDGLDGQFPTIQRLIHSVAGIDLNDTKRELVRSRLASRLRRLGGGDIRHYVEFVQSREGREEFLHMVDILTTNKTNFFREIRHFDFLEDLLVIGIKLT